MANRITIYIADDHPLFRRGVREVIQENDRYLLLGETGDGETALQEIRSRRPMIAVLDVEMPGKNGLDVARILQEEKQDIAVIMLTVHDEDAIFHKAREYGAMGYILKDSASADIQLALEAVSAGDYFISPKMATLMMKKSKSTDARDTLAMSLATLTSSERNVLLRIAQNKSTKQIAEELHNSPRTIGNHRVNICQKLDLHGTLALFRFALENKEIIEKMEM
jgi:two-component system, NarL family, response regulator DegU